MKNFTAPQLIKKLIVSIINEQCYDDYNQPTDTPEQVELAYDLAVEKRIHWDFEHEVRDSGMETNLPEAPFSRDYETEIRAQCIDGQWIAYPYYYGGGKHGRPECIPWIDKAYFVECKEEQKVVTVRTFTKI